MKKFGIFLVIAASVLLIVGSVSACGGLFCTSTPVDQQAERIIFTMNSNSTISAYVQINYTGSSDDFSWVVPVPSVPEVDVAEISTFDELSTLTAPIFIAPLMPECAPRPVPSASLAGGSADPDVQEGQVEVLAQGTAGPYAYEVVTSDDPDALIVWLRENGYRITPEMEPLVHVYNEENMVFLAMRLQPDQGVQAIQPVKMTYSSDLPMIPLRLTAVAANPNMNVITWIFGDAQAYPVNYANPRIDDANIRGTFFSSDGTNYLTLVDQTVDLYKGRAFITEYAEPTENMTGILDPKVKELAHNYRYVTRFFGRISPEEMTVDPDFNFRSDVLAISNVHDLSERDPKVFWGCTGAPTPEVEYDPAVVPEGFQ